MLFTLLPFLFSFASYLALISFCAFWCCIAFELNCLHCFFYFCLCCLFILFQFNKDFSKIFNWPVKSFYKMKAFINLNTEIKCKTEPYQNMGSNIYWTLTLIMKINQMIENWNWRWQRLNLNLMWSWTEKTWLMTCLMFVEIEVLKTERGGIVHSLVVWTLNQTFEVSTWWTIFEKFENNTEWKFNDLYYRNIYESGHFFEEVLCHQCSRYCTIISP